MINSYYTKKNYWLNQQNVYWFNHSILLLYRQQNFRMIQKNYFIDSTKIFFLSKILLIKPKYLLIQPDILVRFDAYHVLINNLTKDLVKSIKHFVNSTKLFCPMTKFSFNVESIFL